MGGGEGRGGEPRHLRFQETTRKTPRPPAKELPGWGPPRCAALFPGGLPARIPSRPGAVPARFPTGFLPERAKGEARRCVAADPLPAEACEGPARTSSTERLPYYSTPLGQFPFVLRLSLLGY